MSVRSLFTTLELLDVHTSIAVVIVINIGARLGALEVLVLDLGKSNHVGGWGVILGFKGNSRGCLETDSFAAISVLD